MRQRPTEFDEYACRVARSSTRLASVEGDSESAGQRTQVTDAIQSLPDTYRIVLQLRDSEGYDIAETATLLETTEANVKVHLHRARAALRMCLVPPAPRRGTLVSTRQWVGSGLTRRLKGLLLRHLSCMFTCAEFKALIMDYVEETLPAPQRRRFEWHLSMCGECRDYLQAYRRTIEICRAALAPVVEQTVDEVPEDLVQAVLDAVKD